LGGVDVVHGGFDFGVGDDVGDEGFEDVVAELAHDDVELFFDGGGRFAPAARRPRRG